MARLIPKSRTIFGIKYRTVWTDSKRIIGDGQVGLCDPKKRVIYLSKELKDGTHEAWEYYLHEVGHAICEEGSLIQGIHKDLEEVLVDKFAKVMSRLVLGMRS